MSAYDRDWMVRAVCREYDPEMFAPNLGDKYSRNRAIAVCRLCPVLAECAAYAERVGATYGVWAGEFINRRYGFRTDSVRTYGHTGRSLRTDATLGMVRNRAERARTYGTRTTALSRA